MALRFDDSNGRFAFTFNSFYKTPALKEYVEKLKGKNIRKLSEISANVLGKYFTFDDLNEVYNSYLEKTTSDMKKMWGERKDGMLPDDFVRVIIPYTFPTDIAEIYHWTVLNNGSPTNFYEGLNLFKNNMVTSVIQVGFTLTAEVHDALSNNSYSETLINFDKNKYKKICRVFLTFERQFISRVHCTCGEDLNESKWCRHVCATIILRIVYPKNVKVDIPILYQLQNKSGDEAKNVCMHIIPHLTTERVHDLFTILENVDVRKPESLLNQGFYDVTTGMGHGTMLTQLKVLFQAVDPILLYFEDIRLNLNVVDYETLSMPLQSSSVTEQTLRFLKMTSNNKSLINLSCSLMRIQEMVFKFEECGLYSSILFLIRILYNEEFISIIVEGRRKTLMLFRQIFYSDHHQQLDLITDIINMNPETVERETKVKIIHYIINECGGNIRHYLYDPRITKDDLFLIRHMSFILMKRLNMIVFGENNLLQENDNNINNYYDAGLYVQLSQIIKECGIIMYDKFKYIENDNIIKDLEEKFDFNEYKNHPMLILIDKMIDKRSVVYSDFFARTNIRNIYNFSQLRSEDELEIEKNLLYKNSDVTLMKRKNIFCKSSKTLGEFVSFIQKNLQDWSNLKKDIDNTYGCKKQINSTPLLTNIICTKCKNEIDIEHERIKRIVKSKYKGLYTNIKFIYDMTVVVGKELLYKFKTDSFSRLIFTVLTHPRPFLFDDDEEVYLWASLDKIFSLVETAFDDNELGKQIAEKFCTNFDKLVEVCRMTKEKNNIYIINLLIIAKIASYCKKYMDENHEILKINPILFDEKYYFVLYSCIEYRPKIKEGDFPLFYECYYLARRQIIIEELLKSHNNIDIVHSMVNRILDTDYGHLYSDHRANCYSIDPSNCLHVKYAVYKKCYGLYARHMIQLTKSIFLNAGGSFDSAIFFDHDNTNGRGIRNNALYKVALVLACYVGCLKVQGAYLFNREYVNYVFTVFRPYDKFHPEALNILKMIRWENCFEPMEMYTLLNTAMQSQNPDMVKDTANLLCNILSYANQLHAGAVIDILNFISLRRDEELLFQGIDKIITLNMKQSNKQLTDDIKDLPEHIQYLKMSISQDCIDPKVYFVSGKTMITLFMKRISRKYNNDETKSYIEDRDIFMFISNQKEKIRKFRKCFATNYVTIYEASKANLIRNSQQQKMSYNNYNNRPPHQQQVPPHYNNQSYQTSTNYSYHPISNGQMMNMMSTPPPLQPIIVGIPIVFLRTKIFCTYRSDVVFNEMPNNPLSNVPVNFDYTIPYYDTTNDIFLSTTAPLCSKEMHMLDGSFDLFMKYLIAHTEAPIYSRNFMIKNSDASPPFRQNVMYICEYSCHLGPRAIACFLEVVEYSVNQLDLLIDIYTTLLPIAFMRKSNPPYTSKFIPPSIICLKNEEINKEWNENFFLPSFCCRRNIDKSYVNTIDYYRRNQGLVIEVDQELLTFIENNYKNHDYPTYYGRFAMYVAQILYVRLNYLLMGNKSIDGLIHDFEKFFEHTKQIFTELFVIYECGNFPIQLLKKFLGSFIKQNNFKRDAYNTFRSKLNDFYATLS
uniref:SWIM-type domain-containing protein n=1 Tax=Parastrongyloides trichosuri TaxID=131310 RepID=A0A0N4ZQA1_PARTI